jgi:hypothetical protein
MVVGSLGVVLLEEGFHLLLMLSLVGNVMSSESDVFRGVSDDAHDDHVLPQNIALVLHVLYLVLLDKSAHHSTIEGRVDDVQQFKHAAHDGKGGYVEREQGGIYPVAKGLKTDLFLLNKGRKKCACFLFAIASFSLEGKLKWTRLKKEKRERGKKECVCVCTTHTPSFLSLFLFLFCNVKSSIRLLAVVLEK